MPIEAFAASPTAVPYLDSATTASVTAFADTLIPRTDTPGAQDAGVPGVFDALMRDWATPEHRGQFLGALKAIDSASVARNGKPLATLPRPERTKFLQAYDAEQFAAPADPLGSKTMYLQLKELIVSLYYLSEPGATIELRYEQVPGAWEASIPITAETRAWAGANVG
ncbi:gluconate 2-dehydrogenase subunit 3 family protein [Sphingobium sp. H39-3-25]|uniref:gluconate 2-dehydrogenase subunit 3 family protein n=1 Tax=Sphingobium arseniciresistens TaxID=3030834 RepID=UPI0023B9BA96|nr:gluconate 2-dehydrogenase subunit 3 family protein [Sphingobium arseniciresistens]